MSTDDETLRALERVAESGDRDAALALAGRLERLGRQPAAARVLLRAARDAGCTPELRVAIARHRGPAASGWPLPLGDARNTRRSRSKGPRGPRGSSVREATHSGRGLHEVDTRPPLVGPRGQVALAYARPEEKQAVRSVPLAFAADGTLYSLDNGVLVAHEPDGVTPLLPPIALGGAAQLASLAVLDDGSLVVVHESGELVHVEPWGTVRLRTNLGLRPLGFAYCGRQGRIVVTGTLDALRGEEGSVARPVVRSYDTSGALRFERDISLIGVADPPLLTDDGRIVVVGIFGNRALVLDPDGAVERERELKFGERIGGAGTALGPDGAVVIFTWDQAGTAVERHDPRTGAQLSGFHVNHGYGAPVIDSEGVIYLRAADPVRIVGRELATGQEVYKLLRKGVRDDGGDPKTLALADGEVVLVEKPPVTDEMLPPFIVRGRGA